MSAGQPIAQSTIGKTVVTYKEFLDAFQNDPGRIHDAVENAAAKVANGDPVMQQKLVAEWNNAIGALTKSAKPGLSLEESGGGVMHTPQNDMASRIQSMIVQQATAKGNVGTLHPAAAIATPHGQSFAPAVLFVKFDNSDIAGWLGMLPELIFKPDKALWVDPSPVPETIPDDARIAVFGDWGTGLYGAPAIAASIAGLDRCDVVLHVGDTYYSGEDNEVHDRLIGDWPKRPAPTINRSLNGNHEMYSGGKGYFRALNDFFHQSASCFAMQNSNWILVGLDTAYNDFDLDAKQVAWLEAIVAGAGTRKLILFSHHQPFSQLDDQGPKLQVALTNLLKQQRIHAWYWGHEHRLVIYDPHPVWGFKGRCIGNGGFPALRDDLKEVGGDVYKFIKLLPKPFAPSGLLLDGPNFWITQAPNSFSPHGYAFLQFDGASVSEIFRVPNNIGILKQDV